MSTGRRPLDPSDKQGRCCAKPGHKLLQKSSQHLSMLQPISMVAALLAKLACLGLHAPFGGPTLFTAYACVKC